MRVHTRLDRVVEMRRAERISWRPRCCLFFVSAWLAPTNKLVHNEHPDWRAPSSPCATASAAIPSPGNGSSLTCPSPASTSSSRQGDGARAHLHRPHERRRALQDDPGRRLHPSDASHPYCSIVVLAANRATFGQPSMICDQRLKRRFPPAPGAALRSRDARGEAGCGRGADCQPEKVRRAGDSGSGR